MEYHIVYAKFDGCKSFKAFDVNEGRQVGNLIYASLVENTEDTRSKLQKSVRPAVNGRTVTCYTSFHYPSESVLQCEDK